MPVLTKTFFALFIIFLSVGLGCFGFYIFFKNRQTNLYKNGTKIDGTIIKKEIKHIKNGDSYYIQYEFDWQGKKYSGQNRIKKEFFDSLTLPTTIKIIIDANNPKHSTIDSLKDAIDNSSLVFNILFLVFSIVGAGFLVATIIIYLTTKK